MLHQYRNEHIERRIGCDSVAWLPGRIITACLSDTSPSTEATEYPAKEDPSMTRRLTEHCHPCPRQPLVSPKRVNIHSKTEMTLLPSRTHRAGFWARGRVERIGRGTEWAGREHGGLPVHGHFSGGDGHGTSNAGELRCR